jgi:hypothetical protein
MSCVLGAASALVGRCSVPARFLQHHALLGAMLSQRSLARVALQDKRFLGSERLQLLCCGSPLSAPLLRKHRLLQCATSKRNFIVDSRGARQAARMVNKYNRVVVAGEVGGRSLVVFHVIQRQTLAVAA